MRIAMGVEYNGSAYHGWQAQKTETATVQAMLELAIATVADHPVRVFCAGRTDARVHGVGQVIHFDSDAQRTERGWLLGTNVNLPRDVNVTWVKPVSDDFHARFKAESRSYRYIILNRSARSSIWHDRAVWIHQPLDEGRMSDASQVLMGTHDFTSYRAIGCQAKSPVKTIHQLDITREGPRVMLDISADAFLHHMVRNIAGVLIAIGKGEREVSWSEEVLMHRDRSKGGVTAPPQGLYLMQVGYPSVYGIPSPPPF